MPKWFRGRDDDRARPATSELPLRALEQAVVLASLSAAADIQKAWPQHTGIALTNPQDGYAISMEILYFFLHIVNRDAFELGGSAARDQIQDALVVRVLDGVIRASFDARNARAEFDSERWFKRMLEEAIENLNSAEMEYGHLTEVFGDGADMLDFSQPTVLVALHRNVAAVCSEEDNLFLRTAIGSAVVAAYSNSLLPHHVKLACEA
jgi:hypothetical protein